MESRLSSRQGEVERVEAVESGLTFDLIHCKQAELGRTVVFTIASGVGPAVGATVVTETAK